MTYILLTENRMKNKELLENPQKQENRGGLELCILFVCFYYIVTNVIVQVYQKEENLMDLLMIFAEI